MPESKIYSQTRVKHVLARGGWMGVLLVVNDGESGQEPRGEARVHPRLPEIMRTNFEKNISKDFKKNVKPRLGVANDGGGRRFCGGGWGVVVFGQR